MKIGAMNNPSRDIIQEIRRIAENGFDYIDLTVEPPQAYYNVLDASSVKNALLENGLEAVGHTAFFLPIASPITSLRESALAEIEKTFCFFKDAGIAKVTVHPQWKVPLHDAEWVRQSNIDAFARLADTAKALGMKLLLENVPGAWSRSDFLATVFDSVPSLGFHLDIGHANLDGPINRTKELLQFFGHILEHVHVSDNLGGDMDMHLPLGAGAIDWPEMIGLLKRSGYDATITAEVFSRDLDYLYLSKEKLRSLWEKR